MTVRCFRFFWGVPWCDRRNLNPRCVRISCCGHRNLDSSFLNGSGEAFQQCLHQREYNSCLFSGENRIGDYSE